MLLRSLWALSILTTLCACGANQSPPDSTSAGPATSGTVAPSESAAPATSTDAAPSDSPRRKQAKLIVRVIAEPEVDFEQAGKIAATGFGEVDFGLPAGQSKALGAVVSNDVDPSQCSAILGSALDQTAKPAVEKRCGSLDALKKKVAAAPAPKKARELMSVCKIASPEGADASKLNPWAVLLSTVVGDELAADAATNEDEAKIAKALAGLCPVK